VSPQRMPVQPETNGHEMNFRMAELAEDQFAHDTKAEADALAERPKDFSALLIVWILHHLH
jgi:hypothetical protein